MYVNQIYPNGIIQLFPKHIVEDMENNGKEMFFKKGALITNTGRNNKDAYLLKKGNVSTFYLHEDGKECILGVLSSGDIINLLDVFTDKEGKIFSKALTETRIIAIEKKKVKRVVEHNPAIAMSLLNYFSKKNLEMIEIMSQVAYGKVEVRLIFLLRKLADPTREKHGWYPLPISITHKDIAGMIASTRETVTVLINRLIQSGIIRQQENRIWIQL